MYAIDWSSRARRQLAKLGDREMQRRPFEAIGLLDVDTRTGIVLVQEIRKRDERTT